MTPDPTVGSRMRRFWDERAEEDAFFFVDNRVEYGNPDLDHFWKTGEADLATLLGMVGAEIRPTDTVVEIGCGVGRLTRGLARDATRVFALDVSERMLELAKRHNPQLENVDWLLGDGTSLEGVETGVANACVSHVVFQHIPDPAITLGYVTDIGRVLATGGWAAFQISNDPSVHARHGFKVRARQLLAAARGRGPRGQQHPDWRGSMIELDELRRVADEAGMDVERVANEGTQFCVVLLRRRPREQRSAG